MPSRRFYCPGLAVGTNELLPEESHHAAVVMRSQAGETVELFDGRGVVASGIIECVSRRSVTVQVGRTQTLPFELRHRLTLAVAMSKAHRQGYLVEKCTELGVAAIWPIIAAHSVTRPGEAAVEKWSRRAIEAAKQSGRAWVPVITPVATFTKALSRASEFSIAFFADLDPIAIPILNVLCSGCEPQDSVRTKSRNPTDIPTIRELIAFVGPEGGWSLEERRAAREANLVSVSLSPTVLRAETAAVAICVAAALTGA